VEIDIAYSNCNRINFIPPTSSTAMKIIPSEEFELSVRPIYERVFQFFESHGVLTVVPSKSFDIMRFMYDDYEAFEIKPDCLMKLLADISTAMGDSYIYLSFPLTSDEFTHEELPRHFIATIDEVIEFSVGALEAKAGSLLRENRAEKVEKSYFYPDSLIYSSQGSWAVFASIDHYGWLATSKGIFTQLENKYFDIDMEFERQFLDYMIIDNQLPLDWKYKIGDDQEFCVGWLREIILYMCKKDANLDEGIDITEAYRTILRSGSRLK
jgi:hypothetical protein